MACCAYACDRLDIIPGPCGSKLLPLSIGLALAGRAMRQRRAGGRAGGMTTIVLPSIAISRPSVVYLCLDITKSPTSHLAGRLRRSSHVGHSRSLDGKASTIVATRPHPPPPCEPPAHIHRHPPRKERPQRRKRGPSSCKTPLCGVVHREWRASGDRSWPVRATARRFWHRHTHIHRAYGARRTQSSCSSGTPTVAPRRGQRREMEDESVWAPKRPAPGGGGEPNWDQPGGSLPGCFNHASCHGLDHDSCWILYQHFRTPGAWEREG